jgi:hypothetical protein
VGKHITVVHTGSPVSVGNCGQNVGTASPMRCNGSASKPNN